ERTRSHLEVRRQRLRALAALYEPRRAVAVRRPDAASFPPRGGIVDTAVETFRVEAQRIRHAQYDHPAVRVRDQAVVQVARLHGYVPAEAERVVLIDPRVVARLGAVFTDAVEPRAGVLIKGPALWAVIAGRLGPVERTFALAPIERAEVTARERHPHDAVAVDVGAARAEAGRR